MKIINPICINLQKIKKDFEDLNLYQKDEVIFFKRSTNFLKKIRDEKILPQIIQEILSNSNYLTVIASNSYRHVNHFSKIVFINDFNNNHCRLTLHIWKPPFTEKQIKQELIHDHRFSFSSLVISGIQIHEIFKESSGNIKNKIRYQKYKYVPSKTSNIHDCFFEKYVYLDKIGKKIINKNNIYSMKNHFIHRILFPTGNEPIISFLVRGPRKKKFTHTYNTFYPREGTVSSVPMYTPEELKNLLQYTLNKI
ncbi:hypothetical protein [Pantoea sp. Aalb]|uniref:hypothetical protein n=1 Tax=Pantoea sp. Aalb TaxID=2576762 RepID=UPI0013238E98|nr:hypothetical protein [Pantoea sp. Aalb]MXP68009.1 hypothetical protein [Pantoea sp. Aalb]